MPRKHKQRRNDALVDKWSFIHLGTGVLAVVLLPGLSPLFIWLVMLAWEPFEILVLSPFLGRFGIVFGFESLRNSLSDVVFNTLGVAMGILIAAYFS